MRRHRFPRACLVIGALAALATPIAPAIARPKRAPVEAPPPPPPPPPPAAAGLPDRILGDAAAYEAWLTRVTATSPDFKDGAQVAEALKAGAAYEPRALVRGAIAYAAIAALEDPTFVAQIRAAGTTPEYRQAMARYILLNPVYVFQFRNSDVAAGLARQALGEAGLKLYAAGKTVKLASYSVQHQSWSKQDVADRGGRLAAVEAAAENPIPPADDQIPVLQRAASGEAPLSVTAPPAEPPYPPMVARALQLAAVAAIGEATDQAYDNLTQVMVDDDTTACLHMAKLNLHQCLAVAKPNYEDIFCLGQHAMADTGTCLVKNAGMDMPIEAPPPPPPTPVKSVKAVKKTAKPTKTARG
jgi:hypothetical protein